MTVHSQKHSNIEQALILSHANNMFTSRVGYNICPSSSSTEILLHHRVSVLRGKEKEGQRGEDGITEGQFTLHRDMREF